jgi:hypothetical protein
MRCSSGRVGITSTSKHSKMTVCRRMTIMGMVGSGKMKCFHG